jgi:hypothetical protein
MPISAVHADAIADVTLPFAAGRASAFRSNGLQPCSTFALLFRPDATISLACGG